MNGPSPAAMPAHFDALLERQQRAILARDPLALDEATRALDAAVRALAANLTTAGAAPREALERLRGGLRTNAGLLGRAHAGNARALAAMFDAEGLYRPDGEGLLAQVSRPLDTA